MNKSTVMGSVGGLVVGLLIGSLALQSGGDQQEAGSQSEVASKQEAVNWSMPSSFPATMLIGGTGGKDFEENVRVISNGTLNIRFFDPGALVPPLEIFDAVSAGAANTGWSSSGYWAGKVPALQFFAAVPFGPGRPNILLGYTTEVAWISCRRFMPDITLFRSPARWRLLKGPGGFALK